MIGRLEASVENLERTVAHMDEKLTILVSRFDRAEGGWKVLASVAVVAGSVGAGVVKLLAWASALPIK